MGFNSGFKGLTKQFSVIVIGLVLWFW